MFSETCQTSKMYFFAKNKSGAQLEAQLRGRGRSLFPFFEKWKENVLILEKNALIVFIYGLNFSFKILF